jgi:hypothetical protein
LIGSGSQTLLCARFSRVGHTGSIPVAPLFAFLRGKLRLAKICPVDRIVEKVMGPEDQRRATAVKRLDIREILGTKIMREITLK